MSLHVSLPVQRNESERFCGCSWDLFMSVMSGQNACSTLSLCSPFCHLKHPPHILNCVLIASIWFCWMLTIWRQWCCRTKMSHPPSSKHWRFKVAQEGSVYHLDSMFTGAWTEQNKRSHCTSLSCRRGGQLLRHLGNPNNKKKFDFWMEWGGSLNHYTT